MDKAAIQDYFKEIKSLNNDTKGNITNFIYDYHVGRIFLKNKKLDTPFGRIVESRNDGDSVVVVTEKGNMLEVSTLSTEILIEIAEEVSLRALKPKA